MIERNNSKKILIVTWCFTSLNYGELLQAYAMQSIMKKLGYEPEIVSYLTGDIRRSLKKNTIYKKNVLGYFKFAAFIKKRMCKVYQFSCIEQLDRICEKFDTFVCGSDQIWNPKSFDHTGVYALDFGKKEHKKVAYAPSLGIEKVSFNCKNNFEQMAKCIHKIDYISVREQNAKELLEQRISKNVQVVLDPTLLVSKKEWDRIASNVAPNKKYAVIYMLGQVEKYTSLIQKIIQQNKIDTIIWIDITKDQKLKLLGIKNVGVVSPQDFLSYIKNAEVVITDSFHGLMFSIKYQKQFYIVTRKYKKQALEGDSRITDILNRLQIKNRIVNDENNQVINRDKINYSKIRLPYEKERSNSINYLKEALK